MQNAIDPTRFIVPLQLDQIHAADGCPTARPQGGPRQVHLLMDVTFLSDPGEGNLKFTFTTPFETAQALDRFIEMLLIRRESVWGAWQRNRIAVIDSDSQQD